MSGGWHQLAGVFPPGEPGGGLSESVVHPQKSCSLGMITAARILINSYTSRAQHDDDVHRDYSWVQQAIHRWLCGCYPYQLVSCLTVYAQWCTLVSTPRYTHRYDKERTLITGVEV
jgi:hypothetical protein